MLFIDEADVEEEFSFRNIAFDFWQTWEAAETCRHAWFFYPEIKLDNLMTQHCIHLDDEAKEKLTTAIVYTVEKMDETKGRFSPHGRQRWRIFIR